jgi:hypothetical protein
MKKVTFIEAEQIGFEEIDNDLVALKLADEKFLIDVDTFYDLAFRCAAFLAHIESRPEEEATPVEACSECLEGKSSPTLH